MRSLIALVCIFGCGSDNRAGTLICKSSSDRGAVEVRLAVAKGQLDTTRDRAKSVAKLESCHFEAGELVSEDGRLGRPERPTIDVKMIDPPAPPPPPPPQPSLPDPADDDPDDDGVAGGVVGGVPAPPQNVPPTMLEGLRISGDKMIAPDDAAKTQMQRDGKDRVVGSYKLCLGTDGVPTTVSQLKSTGYPSYDTKIQAQMRGWRYRPYIYNADAIPVCTAVTFIYSQSP